MRKLLDKFCHFVDKIGKYNFALAMFLIIVFVVMGLYTTFSLRTYSDDFSIIDGIETYKFIISASDKGNIVTIPSKSSKNIAITVTNPEKVRLKYGIYYSTIVDLSDVMIGYLSTNDYQAVDILEADSEVIVTIKIYNDSDNDVMISFGLIYGLENGGELKKDNTKEWVKELEYERFNLNEAKVGSYVKYIGTNGCLGDSCSGKNANYVDSSNMGYCKSNIDNYNVSGWRIAYIKDLSPYIISAGAVECINLLGNESSKLDNVAVKYCNPTYIYGGICSDVNSWNINVNDFKNITGSNLYYNTLDDNSCFESKENSSCGFSNDLMDIGSWYWVNDESGVEAMTYAWNPTDRFVVYGVTEDDYGVRPILRLDTNIEVVGGKGTMDNPYLIRNAYVYNG